MQKDEVGTFVEVCDGANELDPVQHVVVVVVVQLEVVELQLFVRHLVLWLLVHSVQVLHDVPETHFHISHRFRKKGKKTPKNCSLALHAFVFAWRNSDTQFSLSEIEEVLTVGPGCGPCL